MERTPPRGLLRTVPRRRGVRGQDGSLTGPAPRAAQGRHDVPRRARDEVVLLGTGRGDGRLHRHPRLHPRCTQGHEAGGRSITVGPDAILLYGAILLLCALGFFALWKRKRTILCFDFFLVGFGLTVSLDGRRLRLHLLRSVAHAAGLEDQQVRHDQCQGHRQGGCGAAPGSRTQGDGQGVRTVTRQGGRAQAAHRQQALHAESAAAEEDPQADASREGQPAGSTSSAERRSCSTSARRRTRERAVGSSPRARSTSTSVTIPITVE